MTIGKAVLVCVICYALVGCAAIKSLRGGIYRDLDANLTIARIIGDPKKYLDKQFVFSVRYYKKGDRPCPLGDNYVNFSIADRVSYITLDKIWIKKGAAGVLDRLKEMQVIIVKAKVFKIDEAKDPNIEALEIVPDQRRSWWETET